MFGSLKLKHKLIALVLFMGFAQIAGGLLTYLFVHQQAAAEMRASQTKMGQMLIEHSNRLVYAVVMDSRGIYMSASWDEAKPYADGMPRTLKELGTAATELTMQGLNDEAAAIAAARALVDDFIRFRTELLRLASEVSTKDARVYGDNDANRANRKALNLSLDGLTARYAKYVEVNTALAETWRSRVDYVSEISAALPFATMIFSVFFIIGGFARPLDGIKASVMSLAAGQLNTQIYGADRKDEIGDIAGSLLIFRDAAIANERLEREAAEQRAKVEEERAETEAQRRERVTEQTVVVSTLAASLTKMAGGDLTTRIETEFTGVFAQIRTDFNEAVERLNEAMRGVTTGTAAIKSGSEEIASASADLSLRTESQAASLEETAAALGEITATVRKTAEGARHVREIVLETNSEADQSADVVRVAVTAMSEIEKSSKEINQIIGVIDEIAFQTNLLALNAGVEAARAGDAGRGFAVVASEVRALAQRSADAAKEIKGLILASSGQVDNGVKLVAKTGEALTSIAKKVASINVVVGDIAMRAREQAASLQEVNTAVDQMDQMTQQNAAMAEEATAASHSLTKETEQLAVLMGQFKIGGMANVSMVKRELQNVAPRAIRSAHARHEQSARAKPKMVANGASFMSDDPDWTEY